MKTLISDFTFIFSGYGHYKIVYSSPVTGKTWETKTSNMMLVDLTKNEEYPKQKDLEELKRVCKTL